MGQHYFGENEAQPNFKLVGARSGRATGQTVEYPLVLTALPASVRYFHEIGVATFFTMELEGKGEAIPGFALAMLVIGILGFLGMYAIFQNSHDFVVRALGAEEVKIIRFAGRPAKLSTRDGV